MRSSKTQSGTIAPFLQTLRGDDDAATSVSQAIHDASGPPMIVNKSQFTLLDVLAANGGASSMAELETKTGFASSDLMSAVLVSVQAGFVTLDWPAGDLVRLTVDGREALDRFNA